MVQRMLEVVADYEERLPKMPGLPSFRTDACTINSVLRHVILFTWSLSYIGISANRYGGAIISILG
jgi:hypothetical protein